MKRFLYILLAAAVAGASPAPFAAEAIDIVEDVEGISEVLEDSGESRPGSGGGVQAAGVIVRPIADDEILSDADAGRFLIVDRSRPNVAAVRTGGGFGADGNAAPAHLLNAALRDSWELGDLAVEIESPLAFEDIASICQRNRFLYLRTINRDGRAIHRFLADLYTMPRDEHTTSG